MKAVKAATLAKATKLSADAIRKLNKFSKKSRSDVDTLVKKLGIEDFSVQDWLVLTPKDKIPKPEKEFFPRPPKRAGNGMDQKAKMVLLNDNLLN